MAEQVPQYYRKDKREQEACMDNASQGPIPIAGADWAWWQLTTAQYDHATRPGYCPICQSVGWLWKGWFSCDGPCQAIAVIADGRTFLPVPISQEPAP